jgi:hypothetical protein
MRAEVMAVDLIVGALVELMEDPDGETPSPAELDEALAARCATL